MVGVVPLGTGNDLARVLGWGSQAQDEEKIPQILADMEQSSFKLLDRWSVHYSADQNIDVSHLLRSNSVSYIPQQQHLAVIALCQKQTTNLKGSCVNCDKYTYLLSDVLCV